MQHFDGARLSPNSVRNAFWHALNEPVCQYLRTRNPRCSTVYIDNSLGPLARESSCIMALISGVSLRDPINLKYLCFEKYSSNSENFIGPAITLAEDDSVLADAILFDVWLTVHRSSMWNKKPTGCHLVLYLFLLYKLLNMYVVRCATYSPMDTQPANRI